MTGIKVEVKSGKRWWYVVADFGDGRPVTKGPMNEADAKAMAAELGGETNEEGVTVRDEWVTVRDESPDDEKTNRKVAFAFFALVGAGVLFVIIVAIAASAS